MNQLDSIRLRDTINSIKKCWRESAETSPYKPGDFEYHNRIQAYMDSLRAIVHHFHMNIVVDNRNIENHVDLRKVIRKDRDSFKRIETKELNTNTEYKFQ